MVALSIPVRPWCDLDAASVRGRSSLARLPLADEQVFHLLGRQRRDRERLERRACGS
jgi:hypothetical protein